MTNATKPIRLYRHVLSGHAHRVELLLSLLGLPCELVAVDMARGAHKAPDFVAKCNPFGQVPVMEDGEIAIADSNAILVYLASRYDPTGRWLPRDPVEAARVQQWLSVAAGQLAYGPATARLAVLFGARVDLERAQTISRQLYDSMAIWPSGDSWSAITRLLLISRSTLTPRMHRRAAYRSILTTMYAPG